MPEDEKYAKLSRFFELERLMNKEDETDACLNPEEINEYRVLSNELENKKLYTFDELRDYHRHAVGRSVIPSILRVISETILRGSTLSEDSCLSTFASNSELDALYKSIDDAVQCRESYAIFRHLADDSSRLEFMVTIREGIMSGIRQKHGSEVENLLYPIVQDELSAALRCYLSRNVDSSKEVKINI